MALRDLALNYENKTINNSFVKGRNLIIQSIVLALQCWAGDWFLDGDIGIPYDLRLANKSLLVADIQDVILSVDGVTSVQDIVVKTVYEGENKNQKAFYITATVTTIDEEQITLNNLVPIIGV